MNSNSRAAGRYSIILYLLLVLACATPGTPPIATRTYDDFVVVTAKADDTFSSLAARYLHDPAKGWIIADFNGRDALTAGATVIIPLRSFNRGGLKADGYQTVPVLCYHNFSTNQPDKLTVSEAAFEEQMKFLHDNGYSVITMDQLLDFLDFKIPLPDKSVVISIDDGWITGFTIAYPVLKKYNFPATYFIYTDFIGAKKALSWTNIKELVDNGFAVQAQSKSHRNLSLAKENESFKDYVEAIKTELTEPQRAIKEHTNKECTYLAYPYGATNKLVIALLKKHGYRGAFTVQQGPNPFFVDNYLINRTLIYGTHTLEEFEKALAVFHAARLQ
ncbi:MAG: polysaccharide deacetylase family protein [Deltaproteobacteria bacterium]|nr:polysaccharide deacetylase family protein [Deltaproteobacteria bacterium]